MVRTLHIRKTLQKRKYLKNGTVSELLTLTIIFYKSVDMHRKACLHMEPESEKNHIFGSLLFFFLQQCDSVPHQYFELLFISFGSISEAIV